MRESRMLRSTRRGLETWHGRDVVTLADERASQRGIRTSTYTGAPVLDPTWERAGVKFLRATRQHRLFSFISINWRGKPLRSFRTIVELIAATTTETGLTVRAELDETKYPKGIKISDAQLATVNLFTHDFHGEWNYTIAPHKKWFKK